MITKEEHAFLEELAHVVARSCSESWQDCMEKSCGWILYNDPVFIHYQERALQCAMNKVHFADRNMITYEEACQLLLNQSKEWNKI